MIEKLPRKIQLAIVVAIAGFAVYSIYHATVAPGLPDEAGGKTTVRLTTEQLDARDLEIQQLIVKKYGTEGSDATHRELVNRIGTAIATKTDARNAPKPLRFHLLSDANAINAFALSTGDVYVTTALVNRMRTEGELAAVLANGAAHATMSHHMHLPEPPAPMIPSFTLVQESAVDARALKIMADAGYNPNAMLSLFEVLTTAYQAGADTQFFSTHPSPDGRLTAIQQSIATLFPNGVPEVLSK